MGLLHSLCLLVVTFYFVDFVFSKRFQDYALDRVKHAEAAAARQFSNAIEDDDTSNYKYLSSKTKRTPK